MKKLDIYIIKKFLGTFFLSLVLLLMIVVVFDLSEKIGDFIDRKAPLHEIIFVYYVNFIPYFANLFSSLFCFVAVIYFTSRMASRTEFVAIFSSGISLNRICLPYFISAAIVAGMSLLLNHVIIPKANQKRIAFEQKYNQSTYYNNDINIHKQTEPGTYIYLNSYNAPDNIGYQFSMEKFKDGVKYYHMHADAIAWDSIHAQWHISNYFIRKINGLHETLIRAAGKDTTFNFTPDDFERRNNVAETMDWRELKKFIHDEKEKGAGQIELYEVEEHKRTALPFANFVLTLIGLSLASRKVRGGIGLHLGLGIGLSFSYIMILQIASIMAINAGVPALIAVWIPNLIFTIIAVYLFRNAPK